MSCIQASACWPSVRDARSIHVLYWSNFCSMSFSNDSSKLRFRPHKPLLRVLHSESPCNRVAPTFAFSGKGNPEGDKEAFSWDSLKKAIEGFRKEPSVQDLLRQQMQEQESGGDGGDGNFPRDGDRSGDSEDEGFAGIFDELVQVILATIGFIFVYIYILTGEELVKTARDYIKYRFGGRISYRLQKAMIKWRRFYRKIVKKGVVRDDWLERAIVTTPTWWYRPEELAHRMIEED